MRSLMLVFGCVAAAALLGAAHPAPSIDPAAAEAAVCVADRAVGAAPVRTCYYACDIWTLFPTIEACQESCNDPCDRVCF